MNNDLKKQLERITNKPRPRPLMFIGWHNGKKVYVRKQSLSYFQLLKKYPPPFNFKLPKAPPHILAKQHHLKPLRLQHQYLRYIRRGFIVTTRILVLILHPVVWLYSKTRIKDNWSK